MHEEDFDYCNVIDSLMNEFGVEYKKKYCTLFVHSSKTSLKDCLLHNGYITASLTVADLVHKRNVTIQLMIGDCVKKYEEEQIV